MSTFDCLDALRYELADAIGRADRQGILEGQVRYLDDVAGYDMSLWRATLAEVGCGLERLILAEHDPDRMRALVTAAALLDSLVETVEAVDCERDTIPAPPPEMEEAA